MKKTAKIVMIGCSLHGIINGMFGRVGATKGFMRPMAAVGAGALGGVGVGMSMQPTDGTDQKSAITMTAPDLTASLHQASKLMITDAHKKYVSASINDPLLSDSQVSDLVQDPIQVVKKSLENAIYGPKQAPLSEVVGKKFSQLHTDAQRLTFLQQEFKDLPLALDFNIPLIAHYLTFATDKRYARFIQKIKLLAQKDHAQQLKMEYVDKAFIDLLFFPDDSYEEQDGILRLKDEIEKFEEESILNNKINDLIELWDTGRNRFKQVAYHEASHALIMALELNDRIVQQLTLQQTSSIGGLNVSIPLDARRHLYDFFAEELANMKASIKMFLAGGIGAAISSGESYRNFFDFVNTNSDYVKGMGTIESRGSDFNQVYSIAVRYCYMQDKPFAVLDNEEPWLDFRDPNILFNLSIVPQEMREKAQALVVECFDDVDAVLRANKSLLDKIVEIAMDKGYVPGDEIYKIAGKARPKYDFELTFEEKLQRDITRWVSWTLKRIEFYDYKRME